MRTTLILNQDGGTIRGMDAREFGDMAAAKLSGNGGEATVRLVSGSELVDALKDAAADEDTDTIVAGGGDGTISAAAAACFHSGKTLGVIPLGTMNLYARSLGLPLDPQAAIEALATARQQPLDIATANGRPFIHQFSPRSLCPTICSETRRCPMRQFWTRACWVSTARGRCPRPRLRAWRSTQRLESCRTIRT